MRLPQPLVVGEEERAALHDGSAGREPELIPAKRQVRIVEESACIESVIPEEFVHRTVESVRAGTGHSADDATRRAAVRRRVVARDHRELSDGLRAERESVGRTW